MIPIAKYQKTTAIDYQQLIGNTVKDKYPYLLLGITVLLIAYLVISGLFGKNISTMTQKSKGEQAASTQNKVNGNEKTYVIKQGDDLWHIAQNTYGSGYNAYDLAKANNIKNPSVIEIGQKIVLPSLTPKPPTTGQVVEAKTSQVTITGARYTIKTGDSLWKIAQDAYGDGYAWTRIVSANNLDNPSLIHVDNTLIIPR